MRYAFVSIAFVVTVIFDSLLSSEELETYRLSAFSIEQADAHALEVGGSSRPAISSAVEKPVELARWELKGDCVSDDTDALASIFQRGGFIPKPKGKCYKITSTLHPATGVKIEGSGSDTIIKLDLSTGTPTVPVIDVGRNADRVMLKAFAVDQNASKLTAPTAYNGNLIGGSAVLIEGNDAVIEELYVSNGFDNGIAIAQIDPVSGRTVTGSPQRVSISQIHTFNNGHGTRTGAGIDIGSASRILVSNSIDSKSCNGFITDEGAGASGVMSNMISDSAQNCSGNVSSGAGFVLAASNWLYTSLWSDFAATNGLWLDATGKNSILSNIQSINSGWNGMYIKGGDYTINNAFVENASFLVQGEYDGIRVDSSAGDIVKLRLSNITTVGNSNQYGYHAVGAHSQVVSCLNCDFGPGKIAAVSARLAGKDFIYDTFPDNMSDRKVKIP